MAKQYSTPVVTDLGDMKVLTNLKAGLSVNTTADFTQSQISQAGGGVSFGFGNTAQYGAKQ